MKRAVVIVFLLMVVAQLFVGCYKSDDGTYTDPITIYEKIGGTWGLTKITQVDEIAVASSLDPDDFVLTNEFNFKTFTITLNVDETFNPTTFEVGGSAPELFIKTGYWELSSAFPTTDASAIRILLYTDEAKTQLADELSVTTLPGSKSTLEFKLTRSSNGTPYVSYQYALKLK